MATAPTRELTGPRASSAVLCARRAVYEGRGEPAAQHDDRTLRLFRRGHVISNAIRDQIIAEYRADGHRPRAEEPVPWPAGAPIGEGHADIYVPHERGIVEITTCKDAVPGAHKFLQAAWYAIEHPRAEKASVLAVDPHTFEDRVYPVDLERLYPRVQAIQQAVFEGLTGGALPPRVAKHPNTFPCSTCPFRDTCWQGWEPEPRDILLSSPGLKLTAEALADAQQTRAEYANGVKQADAEVKRLQELLAHDVPVGEEIEVGSVLLKSWHVEPRRSLSFSTLDKAGVSLPAELEPFVKRSSGYDVWKAQRLWKGDSE